MGEALPKGSIGGSCKEIKPVVFLSLINRKTLTSMMYSICHCQDLLSVVLQVFADLPEVTSSYCVVKTH